MALVDTGPLSFSDTLSPTLALPKTVKLDGERHMQGANDDATSWYCPFVADALEAADAVDMDLGFRAAAFESQKLKARKTALEHKAAASGKSSEIDKELKAIDKDLEEIRSKVANDAQQLAMHGDPRRLIAVDKPSAAAAGQGVQRGDVLVGINGCTLDFSLKVSRFPVLSCSEQYISPLK